jgi:hypothetical protein
MGFQKVSYEGRMSVNMKRVCVSGKISPWENKWGVVWRFIGVGVRSVGKWIVGLESRVLA